jgi:hypothetical protein
MTRPRRIGLRKKKIVKELLDVAYQCIRIEERKKLHAMKTGAIQHIINDVLTKRIKLDETKNESIIDTINQAILLSTLFNCIHNK